MEASKQLVCVFVDCDWGKKNTDLSDKFGIQGYPTVLFLDPEGKQVASLESRAPGAVAEQISQVAKKYGKARFETFAAAADVAKEDKKPILYLFAKPDQPNSLTVAVADPSLKDLVEQFVMVRSDLGKGNADAKTLGITDPALFVLDPKGEFGKDKALLKLTGRKDVKEVRKQLETVLKKFTEGDTGK
jgi:thiol-disulfide isomerase/thioredoxin